MACFVLGHSGDTVIRPCSQLAVDKSIHNRKLSHFDFLIFNTHVYELYTMVLFCFVG